MGLRVKFEITCDTCGYTVIYSWKTSTFDDSGIEIPKGWEYKHPVIEEGLMCPDCLKRYKDSSLTNF